MNIEDLISETTTTVVKQIPLADQKSYLIRHVDSLSTDQKRELGQILIRDGKKSLLQMNAQGTIINLDLASPDLVSIMYNYMYSKLSI
jgi:hypothetical protein